MRKIIFVYLLMCLLVGTAFAQEVEGSFWDYVEGSESDIHNLNPGNVGIGNLEPFYKLDVGGTVNATEFRLSDGNIILNGGWLSSDGGDEGVYVDNDGYVGIGTSNPTEMLEVNGNVKLNASVFLSGNSIQFTGETGVLIAAPDRGSFGGGMLTLKGGNGVSSEFNGGNVYIYGGASGTGEAGSGSVDGNIILAHNGLDEQGNVGIGTTNPTSRLDISGGNISLNGGWLSFDGGNEGVYVDNEGNVGIGTASPGEKLEVNGNILLYGPGGGFGTDIIKTKFGRTLLISGGEESAGGDLRLKGGENTEYGPGPNVFIYGGSSVSAGDNGNLYLAHTGSAVHGNVGIATTTIPTGYKLAVAGNIIAEEIVVETGWSDFVFEDDYNLKSLNEVENFINTNKHLPEIPSAAEVAENGVSLGEMQSKLLQKVEELTLYMIDLKKENEELKERITGLEKR